MNTAIIEYLQANGEKLETEIAAALRLPMAQVQGHLAQLSAAGDVICCKVTRYLGGKKVEGTVYRLARARSGKPIQALMPHKTRT